MAGAMTETIPIRVLIPTALSPAEKQEHPDDPDPVPSARVGFNG